MRRGKNNAKVLGLRLILGIVLGVFTSLPAIEKADYLERMPAIRTQVFWAIFFQAAMVAVYILVAATLERSRSEGV